MCVRSFLYLFYTLIKLYYTKALSDQALSLDLDWILIFWRPRIPASFVVHQQPFIMYGCESWTIKKAECPRIDVFELWYWRRLLRVPWTARRSNQSILKEISPECSLEGLRLKLKPQYFGHLTLLKRPWYWKRLKARAEVDDRGWDGWMASLTWWTWVWVNSGSWWWTGRPGML